MEHQEVRKAIHQAKYDDKSSTIYFVELAILAVVIGICFKSWAWGLGSYVAILILMQSKIFNSLLAIFFIILWALVGWVIGKEVDGIMTGIFGGILAFIISVGVHFSALTWIDDFTNR